MKRIKNGLIGGVCGGLAKKIGIDPLWIRLIFILLIYTPFPIVLMYIATWLLTEEE